MFHHALTCSISRRRYSARGLFLLAGMMDTEFGRRGEDVCERPQKVGQSQTNYSLSRNTAQTYSSLFERASCNCPRDAGGALPLLREVVRRYLGFPGTPSRTETRGALVRLCLRPACRVREYAPINIHHLSYMSRCGPHGIGQASQQTGCH